MRSLPATALLDGQRSLRYVRGGLNLRGSTTLVLRLRELDLDAVDAVHAVDEEDQNEDECDLLDGQPECVIS